MMLRHEEGRWLLDDPIELHLPEFTRLEGPAGEKLRHRPTMRELLTHGAGFAYGVGMGGLDEAEAAYLAAGVWRSEEHTSELQSLMRISYAVFCLKKTKHQYNANTLQPTID